MSKEFLALQIPEKKPSQTGSPNISGDTPPSFLETAPLTWNTSRSPNQQYGTSSSPLELSNSNTSSPFATSPIISEADSDDENPFSAIPLAISSLGDAPLQPVYDSSRHLSTEQHRSLASHPYYSRRYPSSIDNADLEVETCERPPAESSLLIRKPLRNCCYTPCAMPCLSSCTFIVAVFFILLLVISTRASNDDRLLPVSVLAAIVFGIVVIAYWFLFLYRGIYFVDKPLPKWSKFGRTTYDLMHKAFENTHSSPTSLTTRINELDAARPQLFLRVEGYANEHDMVKASLYDGRPYNPSSPLLPLPGFTHHLAVPLRSTANISADRTQIEDWFYASTGYSCVSVEFGFELDAEERAWLRRLCQKVRQRYAGHEGCNYIRVGVEYALQGVSAQSEAHWQYPYNEEGRFTALHRAGVNAGLYNWVDVATLHHTASLPDAQLLCHEGHSHVMSDDAKSSACCSKSFYGVFTKLGASISILLCMYLPYVCCFRLIVRDVTYTHLKKLTLKREHPILDLRSPK